MYHGKTVGVVVVAHNEEGLVGEVIDTLPEFTDRAYVVDDGSTDETWKEIRTHAELENERRRENGDPHGGKAKPESREQTVPRGDGGVDRPIEPIRHETNRGVGAAIKTGYRRAYEDGIDVTVVMAGDGQMDPDQCHRVVEPVADGRAAYAKGNRLLDSELRAEMSAWRRFGNTLLTVLTKIASGYWKMMDPSNGYTAISHHALETLDIDDVYDDYGAAHDILIRLNVHNMRIADVPMPASYGEEQSGIRYSSFVPRLSTLLLTGFLRRLHVKYVVRDCHPFVLFYLIGGIGMLGGGLEALRNALDSDGSRVRSLLSGLILLVSAGLLAFAMVFDMLDNEDLEFRAED